MCGSNNSTNRQFCMLSPSHSCNLTCESGQYGVNCAQTCPCHDRRCNPVSGACNLCKTLQLLHLPKNFSSFSRSDSESATPPPTPAPGNYLAFKNQAFTRSGGRVPLNGSPRTQTNILVERLHGLFCCSVMQILTRQSSLFGL